VPVLGPSARGLAPRSCGARHNHCRIKLEPPRHNHQRSLPAPSPSVGRHPRGATPRRSRPKRSLPNQDGTPLAKTDRSASTSHLGGPSSWRGSKTFPRAAGASARSASGAPRTLSRACHLPRQGWNLVSQGRQDLRGSEPRARRFQPRLISRSSLLRPVRPHPPHRRGRRRPSACAWPAGPRRSLRQGNQPLLPSPRLRLERPPPHPRLAHAA